MYDVIYMPKGSKKKKPKKEVKEQEGEEIEEVNDEVVEDTVEYQKTSIQITTKVRDRLWKLKFRRTYDEFLQELCEMYEKAEEEV
jgi:hypothetical protein